MRPYALLLLALVVSASPGNAAPAPDELARWQRHAAAVTITRDDWGIAHVHGRTDADAVFGMEYAQAEDDFARVEMNYIKALGRRAEADGDTAIFEDLRMRLFVDPDSLRSQYRASPLWLQRLMEAFADGLNFYLYRHPEVRPRVIKRFEPWMALSFTEGSIGGDIERVSTAELAAFYGDSATQQPPRGGDGDGELAEPSGSNGIAFAPAITRDHHALLWINPHTSFYFRSELQMTSDEGLNAYGAVTWGQFFVYQGFNESAGWMHTSSGVDNIDDFLETVTPIRGRWHYRRGQQDFPLRTRTIVVPYRTATGRARRTFTVYASPHGPVVRRLGDKWVTVSLMQRPVAALIQSYSRTKARDLPAFKRIMELHANSSNNTLFADAAGNIAYLHSNYIPRRDTTFDWTLPVDGSDPRTDYRGLLSVDESPNLVNPASGYAYNCNNWPWSAAGAGSLERAAFPRYVETGLEESPRGQHALRVLAGGKDWTPQSVIAAAFDSWLPAFERLLPPLLAAYDHAPATDSLKARLAKPIAALRDWDRRWGATSVPTTLAVHWGEAMVRRVAPLATAERMTAQAYVATRATSAELLRGLVAATDTLTMLHGTWRTPWGEINRFQRLDDSIEPRFDDAWPSLPVPFTSGIWGSLASFGARSYPDTRKRYGSSGNNFLAVVEFGDTLRAWAVTAGGESGDPGSPHFGDQAERFVTGKLREVYFHPRQLDGHTERVYRPGE
jgi:acyl-homoserine lactone acylase PvdQ